MHIDRYNYETFFLLYTDNELSMADRQAVEAFVQQNPDLKPELEMLQQYIFTPDLQVVFSNKASLLQTTEGIIQPDNCTTCFLLYADNELSEQERAAVERFVHDHPQFSAEFALLCTIKLVPDETLAFGHKKRLYRYEKSMPVLGRWWRSAAAAMLLLGAGALWQQLHKPTAPHLSVAVKQAEHPAGSRKANTTGNAQTQVAGNHPSKLPLSVRATLAVAPVAKRPAQKEPSAVTDRKIAISHTSSTGAHSTHDEPLTALNGKSIHPSGVSSSIIPAGTADHPDAIAAGAPASNRLVTGQGIVPAMAEVGSGASEALLASDTRNENVIFANISVQRKSALRGLFRKASRFIDKTTALKTGQAQGIQIGNIEIAFQ